MTTINEPLIMKTALDTGHFWDSSYPDVLNVDGPSFAKLTARDRVARDAIASMQRADANFDDLVREAHGRNPIFDGEIGPATMKLVNGWRTKGGPLERCPLPDFPPPNASFHYADPELQKAVERMQKATGRGSWPHTDGVHVVKISYDASNAPSSVKGWLAEIKTRSHLAVGEMGVKLVEVSTSEFANIRVSWRVLAGSTIGLAEFNNGTLEDTVFCYLDPGYAPDLEMVLLLLLHENGHNWNCNHRPGYIMNPSIRRVKPKWVERDAAGKIIYRDPSYTADLFGFFGGGPIDQIVVPPPPPPPGDKVIWEGSGQFRLVEVGGRPNPFPV